MADDERKLVWIDRFQTRLAWRISLYLALLPPVFLNLLFAWKLLCEGVQDPIEQFLSLLHRFAPLGVCLLIVLPVLAWDAIRFSHRLVGPLIRFRKAAQDIARGEPVRPIKLRDGDYLIEFRDDFNRMLESLQRRGVPVLRADVPAEGEQAPKKLA
jgi:methyl-accepting chemotaxis protein